ncbi:MAG: 1-acyl-sn-glycerol-3-phosphate acyltransferase [Anaerolineaceae bacterium]|nr:1-acyl-sn-glycerol-3-phosphate acyltransferase [Anaerolineaceae bacterium]
MSQTNLIKYPRRTFIRRILKGLVRILVGLLVKIEITGLENFPKTGPYIVVGNHVSALEPILMVIYTPQQLEYLGTGDIPIDPRMSFISSLYRFIPVMRGQIDQKGLHNALAVLEQNGVLGIFPEGGIWEKNLKKPKIGTSWIAYKSKAPIVPIGFSGMNGAMQKALSFKRPKVSIKIGKLLTYDEIFSTDQSIKQLMNQGALKIMEEISTLLPPEEIINPDQYIAKYIEIILVDENKAETKINFPNLKDFSLVIEHPVIMDVFKRNLKLPVGSLILRNQPTTIYDIEVGLLAIQNYIRTNPGFLSYRFGIDQSLQMNAGIENFLKFLDDNKNNFSKVLIRFKTDDN